MTLAHTAVSWPDVGMFVAFLVFMLIWFWVMSRD